MTNDERNPKPECRKALSCAVAGFVIRILSFLRISSFVTNSRHRSRRLFPRPPRGLGDQAFLESAGCDADVTHLAARQEGLDTLEVGQESPFGDGSYVRPDAAKLFGF